MTRALYPLHAYQLDAVAHLWEHPRACLFLEPGLGKTAITLSSLTPEHLPALVVAPKRPTEHTWPEEARKWAPWLSVAVAAGTPAQRRRAFQQGADVTLISRDNLADAVGGPWRTVVLDELTSFKSRGTGRWKNARKLVKDVPYRWGLTGTPTPNGLGDLWPQLYLIDAGERLGTSITRFRHAYFTPGKRLPSGVITEWVLTEGSDRLILDKIDDIVLSMSTADYLPGLPKTIPRTERFELPKGARRVYDDMRKHLAVEIEPGHVETANGAGAMTGKLSQITAGFLYSDDEDAAPTHLHDDAIDIAREVVEHAESPVLVFYRFVREHDMLSAALPGAVNIRERGAIEAWNAGDVPVLLAHPQSAGHGLNLQHGGHNVLWSTSPWSLEEWDQANARLARQGQTERTIITTIEAENSIDGVIRDRLETRGSVQRAVMDHLKDV